MVEYAHKVYDENLFGAHTNNISARVDSESMLITKSGVNFKDLTVEDIIEVKFNETDKCPSDTLKDALLHVKLYGASGRRRDYDYFARVRTDRRK